MVQGLAELNRNLQLVKTFTDLRLITAMEKGQNLVATHAKSNHRVASGLSRAAIKEHADPRFYTRSTKLVSGIKAEKVKIFVNGLKGEVTASEPYATRVEIGGPNSRAFPFFGPAVTETAPAVILLFATAVKQVIK